MRGAPAPEPGNAAAASPGRSMNIGPAGPSPASGWSGASPAGAATTLRGPGPARTADRIPGESMAGVMRPGIRPAGVRHPPGRRPASARPASGIRTAGVRHPPGRRPASARPASGGRPATARQPPGSVRALAAGVAALAGRVSGCRAPETSALARILCSCYVPVMREARLYRCRQGSGAVGRRCRPAVAPIGETDRSWPGDGKEFYLSANFGTSGPRGAFAAAAHRNLPFGLNCAKGAPFQRISSGNLRERRFGDSSGPLNLKQSERQWLRR
jgi:hypothetical protein